MGYPFCPVCWGELILKDREKDIQEFSTHTLVTRECSSCRRIWILEHVGRQITSMSEKDTKDPGFGFDYICPHCKFQSYVATTYRPTRGWNCLNCGQPMPNESLIPRGGYQLPEITRVRVIGSTSKRRRREGSSTYQRAPRVSKPIPVGAVSLSTLAERLKLEPKKLRSWLRKVGWRKVDEAGSSWVFSPDEADEVVKNFGR